MPPQARNLALLVPVSIFLITILILNACKRDESIISPAEKNFISIIEGNWTFLQYNTFYNETQYYVIFIHDTIYFNTSNSSSETISERYFKDDPDICTLQGIEVIKNWTITNNNGNLLLETQDLCGNSTNYNIYFDNISYHKESELWGRTTESYYNADIQLVNQSSVITIDNLYLYDNCLWSYELGESMRIEYYMNDGSHYVFYR